MIEMIAMQELSLQMPALSRVGSTATERVQSADLLESPERHLELMRCVPTAWACLFFLLRCLATVFLSVRLGHGSTTSRPLKGLSLSKARIK